ncbi:Clp protease-related protein, chloroplastic [Capsicum chinense]|nr:Clp protease-related protein, chloroplastic [Capsicum chinense]
MATHSFSLLSIQSLTSNSTNRQSDNNTFLTHKSRGTSFTGGKLLIRQPQNLNIFTIKRRSSTVATVAFSLPTAKSERAPSEKQSKWSARAIKAFAFAELEARKLKYPNTGTEALLMGILVEGSSSAAKFLRTNGVTLFKVRDEIVKLLGRSDMYYFSPEHPPLTKTAQKALDWAIDEKLKSGEGGEITVTHLALGIWSEKESAGHKIMATLGFDDDKAKELTKFMDRDIEMLYN